MTEHLDRVNARRLFNFIEDGISEALKEDIFDVEFKEDANHSIQETVKNYLSSFRNIGALSDYSVGPFRRVIHTWETLYPDEETRRLAQEAAVIYPGRSYTLTEDMKKYPFVRGEYWLYRGVDEEGYEYTDYLSERPLDESLEVEHFEYWRIIEPYEEVVTDINITPTQPVNSIVMTVKIGESHV